MLPIIKIRVFKLTENNMDILIQQDTRLQFVIVRSFKHNYIRMRPEIVFLFIFLMLIVGCLREETFDLDNEEDIAFMEEYAQRPDVTITDSGLMFRIVQEGDGDSPAIDSRVKVHFIAKMVSGDVIGNSYINDTPLEFTINDPVNPPIAGFAEGLLLMQEGALFELVIPSELAYGDFPPPNSVIYPGATIIMEVELLEILSENEE